MKCPNCHDQYNGNTTCLLCGTTAPTSEWAKSKREEELETELAKAIQRIDQLERKEYQLKKDNIESLDLLAADSELQNRLADQIEQKDKQLAKAISEIKGRTAEREQMVEALEKLMDSDEQQAKELAEARAEIERLKRTVRLGWTMARNTMKMLDALAAERDE